MPRLLLEREAAHHLPGGINMSFSALKQILARLRLCVMFKKNLDILIALDAQRKGFTNVASLCPNYSCERRWPSCAHLIIAE